MGQRIAKLRIEENPHGNLLCIDYVDETGNVYYSHALKSTISVESAHRMVYAMNNPEAVIVTDDMPPVWGERIRRGIRLQ